VVNFVNSARIFSNTLNTFGKIFQYLEVTPRRVVIKIIIIIIIIMVYTEVTEPHQTVLRMFILIDATTVSASLDPFRKDMYSLSLWCTYDSVLLLNLLECLS
jgi:hypothetical protein